jgi:hypothetical protein
MRQPACHTLLGRSHYYYYYRGVLLLGVVLLLAVQIHWGMATTTTVDRRLDLWNDNSVPALRPCTQVQAEQPPNDNDNDADDEYSLDDRLLVQYGDSIYTRTGWDAAPVVLEDYKVVFFTTAKVGCTVFKQLFRRMMGIPEWQAVTTKGPHLLPWNPEVNGLRYLYHYNRTAASRMMTSPDWTRAIFVRDPKTRFLSAYLDKVVRTVHSP